MGLRTVSDEVRSLAEEVGGVADGPVVAVGGGSSGVAAGIIDPDARTVRAPAGIVDWHPAEMTARVLAGTSVVELDAALEVVGQCVALPVRAGGTVGGALALGHSGIRRRGWGPVRDVLLEATVVTAAGQVATVGGPTVKNVSGFDLCRLLVGSLGTLAVIAEVVVRTRPLPPTERWLAGTVDPAAAERVVHRPTAILWDGATTWVLVDGHEVDVDAQTQAAARAGLEPAAPPARFPPHRWSVAPQSLRDTPGEGWIAEWGVGIVHHPAPPEPPPVDGAVRLLHRRIKAAFDPTGRLAPGRTVLPGPAARGRA